MTRVACIGECMVELREQRDGLFSLGFGGDTLNAAVYLARLGVVVDYVTALGADPFSDEMLAAWQAEGIGTDCVLRVPGHLPGLYIIQTDAAGRRPRRAPAGGNRNPARRGHRSSGHDGGVPALACNGCQDRRSVECPHGIGLAGHALSIRPTLWHM